MNHAVQKLRKPLDIFVEEYNIHFGYPRTDRCSTCDSLAIQIEDLRSPCYKHISSLIL